MKTKVLVYKTIQTIEEEQYYSCSDEVYNKLKEAKTEEERFNIWDNFNVWDNDLVGELGDRIVSVVTQLVEKIGDDNAGNYIRARHKLKTVRVPVISHLAATKTEGGFGLLVWKKPIKEEEE